MDYSKMTDDELWAEIEKRYGKEWAITDITDETLLDEVANRLTMGI